MLCVCVVGMFVYCCVSPVDVHLTVGGHSHCCSCQGVSLHLQSQTVNVCSWLPLPSPQVGSVWVYDPVLSEDELQVVESFGCVRIPVNESCHRAVYHPTLFFMLHCDMAMYSNLLGANWGREGLWHVTLLGNPLFYHLR